MYYICIVLRAYKYRLYPTTEQSIRIDKHIGACRFVYNLALETKNIAYTSAKKNLTAFDLMRQLTDLKKECEWLNEIDSQALQQPIHSLDAAFSRFFKGQSNFPRFKSKRDLNQSFKNPHGNRVKILDGFIMQPRFRDGIRIVQERQIVGQIKSTTISKTPTGKYFVSVLVETGKENPKLKAIKESTTIGIDLGLKSFIVTSEGETVDNPKHLRNSMKRLKYLQRQLSKKKKGSSNRNKARQKVALCHEKITNQRKDFLHKLSTKLVSENQTLCFEDLNITGMMKNHKLAGAIQDVGWGMFVEMCKYKAEWNGKNILQIGRFEPSSKMCGNCGSTNHHLKLSDREWTCENCNTTHDRDVNAANNIKSFALKQYRGGVRRGKPVELPMLVGAVKREAK